MEQTTEDTDEFEPGAHPGATMACPAASTAATRTRLAVVADPHVATRASGTSKLFDHTERHLRNAVADAAARDVNAVVSVGDLTTDGEPWNYSSVWKSFQRCPAVRTRRSRGRRLTNTIE